MAGFINTICLPCIATIFLGANTSLVLHQS